MVAREEELGRQAAPGGTATYLYGFVASEARPDLEGAPRGLAGTGPLRVLDAGKGIWVVVADAPLSRYAGERIEARLRDLDWVSERALEHEDVVEHVMARADVIPAKLFTLFHDDDRALAYARERYESFRAIFRRIAGCREWGLRLAVDVERARQAAVAKAASPRGAAPRSGASYLLAKKIKKDAARNVMDEARERAEALFEELAALGRARTRRDPPAPAGNLRYVLDVAFLVEEAGLSTFEAAVEEARARFAPDGYELTLTGPWPPYHFLQEDSVQEDSSQADSSQADGPQDEGLEEEGAR